MIKLTYFLLIGFISSYHWQSLRIFYALSIVNEWPSLLMFNKTN